MEHINVAALLKNCPTGYPLDCTMYDNLYFDRVDTFGCIKCYIKSEDDCLTSVAFHGNGCYNTFSNAKCVIFPKGKTTWEGFVPPCKFNDGDVVSVTLYPEGIWVGIFKQYQETFFESHCSLNTIGEFRNIGYKDHSLTGVHLASEEEKQKLFKAIKDNGYKWNAETKTLEKRVEPKFKVGDIVTSKNCPAAGSFTIVGVGEDSYLINIKGHCIKFEDQDNYELVPKKFDINTLIPFESRVLVRDSNDGRWRVSFWGCLIDSEYGYKYDTVRGGYRQCIPYENNEHLLGTTDDCDDYYKTWE